MMGQVIWLVSTMELLLLFRSYPIATYVHCATHTLNLCVVSACSIPAIRNTHGVLQEICTLSPKRQAELERQIKDLSLVESRRQKLVNLCITRWVARIKAYEVFMEVMLAVVGTMETISTESGWNSESSQKAASLLTAITQFEFLMAFVVTKCGFGFIKGLTVSLQMIYYQT